MRDIDEMTQGGEPSGRHRRVLLRRLLILGAILLPLIVIVLVVPLININRFQRRIIASLSESLGRPIHLDNISLTVFPLPGLTIENLVIAEDPAFGAEPFVRASSVRATLRASSLWRRRVEFSRISFTEPSINLVRTSNGRWNLESFLSQASRISVAPTAQARASESPRFPYIEASGARLNLKLNQEKTPFSLTDADIALWLSNPQEWQLRLEGSPARTDTSATDNGTLQIEGTLGQARAFNDMPIRLRAEWRNAPMGNASRIVTGNDAGLRGSMTLAAALEGTIGRSTVSTTLHLDNLRRAEFVPDRTITIDIECHAGQTMLFRSLTDLRCSWPPALSNPSAPRAFTLTGSIPNTSQLSSASFDLNTPGIPAATLLNWFHAASRDASSSIKATGSFAGELFFKPADQGRGQPQTDGQPQWGGQLSMPNGTLTLPAVDKTPVFRGALNVRVAPLPANPQRPQFFLAPITLELGGSSFATLDGRFDQTGYELHLTGTSLPSRLLALGTALPQIGDGLANALPKDSTTPVRFDLVSTRPWGGAQLWNQNIHPAAPSRHRKRQ